MTMKKRIVRDEYYPIYNLLNLDSRGHAEGTIAVSQEFFDQYTRAMAEFDKIQRELGNLFESRDEPYGTIP